MQSGQWLEREVAIGDLTLQSGKVLRDARMRVLQRGLTNAPKDNIVLLPGYYGGAMVGNLPLACADSPLSDPRWCVLIPGMLGAGQSTSPSTAHESQRGVRFPAISLVDQVNAQQRLLYVLFGEVQLALAAGWSLGGMQSLQWACLFPDQVRRVAAWCSGVRCYPHNLLFLLGLKAALQADSHSRNGSKPVEGLRAFARIYASRAYSARFVREQLYRQLGFETLDQLLRWWEDDHLAMDHHDLLCVLEMWINADISANHLYQGDMNAALAAIRMPALIMPCASDQYFLAEEAMADAVRMPGAHAVVLESDWGHCAGGPGRESAAMAQLWRALSSLLAR